MTLTAEHVDNPAVEPTDLEQVRADLLDLAETSDEMAARADGLGLRQTARQLQRMSKMLRASRTRTIAQPSHILAAEAYVLTAVDLIADAARKIGAHTLEGHR